MLFTLSCTNWSWDADLQIIHADVLLKIDGDVLIDEPLCVDVGLPALLYSVTHDAEPNRWGKVDEWERMPFFCCGCGDPECRAFSFRIRHSDQGSLELTELEEREHGEPREHSSYTIALQAYRTEVVFMARQFLSHIQGLDYRPYYADTAQVVERLLKQIEA
ncbi:hypothetical protein BK127_34000 [Paenibacillus sp. FSL H7-0331]|nr:hypothetical protein BK127_34000 [Paenibacillus sp. FSL H7-0331]